MCGIIAGFHTGKGALPANEWALNTFENQHSRGTQGFGIVGWKPGETPEVLRSCESAKFMWDLHAKQWPMLMVHHRYPTSTKNKIDQTHPILVQNACLAFDYLVIHNGVISNDEEIHAKHVVDLGFAYTTEHNVNVEKNTADWNDSETFAIELALFIEGQIPEIRTEGSAAFVALQVDKKTEQPLHIFFGRNSNPLHMGKSRGKLHLSSEGEGEMIERDILYFCKPEGEMKLQKKPLRFVPEVVKPIYQWNHGYRTPTSLPTTEQAKETQKKIEAMSDEQFSASVSGGGFDDLPPETPFDEVFQETTTDIDDAVTDCLESMSDIDSFALMPIDTTVKRIRDILESAKDRIALIHSTSQQGELQRCTSYDTVSDS